MAAPRVSIGIPAYNTARYLGAAIASALAQECQDFEVFVCDNVSNDGTPKLCAAVADPRFRYLRFERHLGQAGNWNRCLDEARGDYVILLHADDLLAPGFLRRATEALDGRPTAAFVHCAVTHVDSEARPLWEQRLFPDDRVESGAAFFERLLHDGCIVSPAGVMVRRSAYAAAGRFDERLLWCADWDMWLRLSLHGDVAYLGEPLAFYREHIGSGTAGVIATGSNGEDERRAVESVFALMPPDRGDLRRLRRMAMARAAHRTWCWAEEACRRGHLAATRAGLLEALKTHPPMLLEGRVWGLWLASVGGYRWYERLRTLRPRLPRRP